MPVVVGITTGRRLTIHTPHWMVERGMLTTSQMGV
jgi:hypothetical protein